jgi:hypothetical protein
MPVEEVVRDQLPPAPLIQRGSGGLKDVDPGDRGGVVGACIPHKDHEPRSGLLDEELALHGPRVGPGRN